MKVYHSTFSDTKLTSFKKLKLYIKKKTSIVLFEICNGKEAFITLSWCFLHLKIPLLLSAGQI